MAWLTARSMALLRLDLQPDHAPGCHQIHGNHGQRRSQGQLVAGHSRINQQATLGHTTDQQGHAVAVNRARWVCLKVMVVSRQKNEKHAFTVQPPAQAVRKIMPLARVGNLGPKATSQAGRHPCDLRQTSKHCHGCN
jgi:hypothetical protein